jgi:sn-glycerol 3-phosphate transport system substrate-binding protein
MSGKSDEENKATAEFFEFLSSPEVQLKWHKDTGYVPITEAAYELAKTEGYYDEKPAGRGRHSAAFAAGRRVDQGLPHGLLRPDPRRDEP